jgi:hypothetical protein
LKAMDEQVIQRIERLEKITGTNALK